MGQIALVGGTTVAPEGLGFTLVHEHLRVEADDVRAEWPHLYDEERAFQSAVAAVTRATGAGVRTLCDPTVLGLGRDCRFMQRVVEATGAQVVAATGLYTFRDLPIMLQNRPVDFLADLFVRDITEGIQGTPTRAGFLKFATDAPGVTPDVEKVIRAAARAHRRTGVPIITHSDARNASGLRQIELLEAEGADLSHVVIGHVGDTEDVGYLSELAARGVFLGLDRFGPGPSAPTAQARCRTVVRLLEKGLGRQLLLSQDACATIDWREPIYGGEADAAAHMAYIAEVVLDDLRALGATDDDIRTMTVANPRRLFGD